MLPLSLDSKSRSLQLEGKLVACSTGFFQFLAVVGKHHEDSSAASPQNSDPIELLYQISNDAEREEVASLKQNI